MDYNTLVNFIQNHFTDGLVLVIGSGLSSAEGMPGMPDLANHLCCNSGSLSKSDKTLWSQIETTLATGAGLEAALLKHQPTDTLESWIAQETLKLLLPEERNIIGEVIQGKRTLRLIKFLEKLLKPSTGLPIITTNYDRLIEVACEIVGFHVDSTAIGHYAGIFDHTRSCMGSCQGITSHSRKPFLIHFPRAIVLKPHGSFDWYKFGSDSRRCSMDLDAERLIITPGLNKYRAGYNFPFDKHRDLANNYIDKAARLLVVGYGLNDDHLQTHLLKRIQDGTPTLILNQLLNNKVKKLATDSPLCVCLSKPSSSKGIVITTKGFQSEHIGHDLWDIEFLAKEILT